MTQTAQPYIMVLATDHTALRHGPGHVNTDHTALHHGPGHVNTDHTALHHGPGHVNTDHTALHHGPGHVNTDHTALHHGRGHANTEDTALYHVNVEGAASSNVLIMMVQKYGIKHDQGKDITAGSPNCPCPCPNDTDGMNSNTALAMLTPATWFHNMVLAMMTRRARANMSQRTQARRHRMMPTQARGTPYSMSTRRASHSGSGRGSKDMHSYVS